MFSTTDNGEVVKDMEEDVNTGVTAQFTKVIGNLMWLVDMVD